jgi:hypothetical protein
MRFINFIFSLLILTSFNLSFAAVASLRLTEAGSCTNCRTVSSLSPNRSSLSALSAQVHNIAYYTDNGDREALSALRARNPNTLSMEERAILEASNRIGFLHLPGCGGANNAVLININGRDAIVANGHVLVDSQTGLLKCSATEEAYYYPNASYLNQREETPSPDSFIMRSIRLEPNPINFENHASFKTNTTQDFIIYYLTENISQEALPSGTYNAGQPRGFMPISTSRQETGTTFNIGFDGRYEQEFGRQMSYHQCRYQQSTRRLGVFLHNCDSSAGGSGSLLGTIENGQMTLQAINSSGFSTYDTPTPESTLTWNQGVSSDLFLRSLPGN